MRHLKIPRGFLSLPEDHSGDFFVLGCVDANTVFSVCIYRFQNGLGFQRDGRSLGFWVSNRGESTLLAHDFAVQSLVCYTFCDRWCRKGDAFLLSIPFPVAAEQTDDLALWDGKCVDSLKRNPAVRV